MVELVKEVWGMKLVVGLCHIILPLSAASFNKVLVKIACS
jgi:hypothetical protein